MRDAIYNPGLSRLKKLVSFMLLQTSHALHERTMREIMVCVKQSYDVDSLKVDRSSGLISTLGSPKKMNDFDRNALEEGIRIREKAGGKVIAVSVGPESVKEVLKEALAIGADTALYVSGGVPADIDSRGVAHILSKVYSLLADVDLVIMGEGSVDHYSSQVGPRVAESLGLPALTYARSVEVSDTKVTAERDMEGGLYVTECPLPAVVTVVQEINQPRLPTLRSILGASKKEIRQLSLSELGIESANVNPLVTTEEIRSPKNERKKLVLDGSKPEEASSRLVSELKKEGVL